MDELTLIFQNAMQYNDKESDYHKMADTLRKQARRTQQHTAAHSSTRRRQYHAAGTEESCSQQESTLRLGKRGKRGKHGKRGSATQHTAAHGST